MSQEHHPDIQAVSVGAILSNYQRVRVEHVLVTQSLAVPSLIRSQLPSPFTYAPFLPLATQSDLSPL